MGGKEENIHQVIDGHTSNAADPCLHVAETNVEVLANALLGDFSRNVHVQQIVLADLYILTPDKELVRRRHVLVKNIGGDGCQRRVRYPCSLKIPMLVLFVSRLPVVVVGSDARREGSVVLTHRGQRVLHAACPPSHPPSPCRSPPCRP